MTKPQKTKADRKKRLDSNRLEASRAVRYSAWSPATQLTAWLCVGAIALFYLYALFGWETANPHLSDFTAPGDGAAEFAADETLADQIETLRREIHAMKQRERLLETRIADLQAALGPMTSALPESQGGRETRPAIEVERSALPNRGFGDEFSAASPVPTAETKQPTRTIFAVALGEVASRDALRARWRALIASHGPDLKDLEARYALAPQLNPKAAPKYKLIAGPFANAAEAARICARLAAREQPCDQTVFAGEKLTETTPSLPERKPAIRQSRGRRN